MRLIMDMGASYKKNSPTDEEKKAATVKTIQAEKLVAIIRQPDRNTIVPAVRALYEGGLRLAEITFDRSGKFDKEYTAELIARLTKEFGEKLLVGAGTVMSEEEVVLARQAGARYIISPNCDPQIIRKTKELGLVSIPAAFTPTEIALALNCGADFIKLFPVDQLGAGYVKTVKAPLADAKLLAVGGVTEDNAAAFIRQGFDGVGVGSSLYRKDLIEGGKWSELTALAARFVQAMHPSNG